MSMHTGMTLLHLSACEQTHHAQAKTQTDTERHRQTQTQRHTHTHTKLERKREHSLCQHPPSSLTLPAFLCHCFFRSLSKRIILEVNRRPKTRPHSRLQATLPDNDRDRQTLQARRRAPRLGCRAVIQPRAGTRAKATAASPSSCLTTAPSPAT